MRIPPKQSRRKGIAGILAAVIMFAMLFTAGMGLFLYQLTLNHLNDQASAYSQQALQARSTTELSTTSHPLQGHTSASIVLSDEVTNVGGNTTTIVGFFVKNSTGGVVCASPPGEWGTIPTCSTSVKGASGTYPVLSAPGAQFSVISGGTINITTGLSSNAASLSKCGSLQTCAIGVITQTGNVFVGAFPQVVGAPSITTTLSSIVLAPGSSVYDTAILSDVSSNAGGSVTYYTYNNGVCTGTSTKEDVEIVTNGVVPNSATSPPYTTVGPYSWQAVYTGDPSNAGATSPCEPLEVSPNGVCDPSIQICQSTVSQGLGSLAYDFNSFKWYTSGSCNPAGSSNIGQNPAASCILKDGLSGAFSVKNGVRAYSISQTGLGSTTTFMWFSINVTNADPALRTIVLNQYSQLWFSFFCPEYVGQNGPCGSGPHGQLSSTYFGLVLVNTKVNQYCTGAVGTSCTTSPTVTIPYGTNATLFFGFNEGAFGGSTDVIPLCPAGTVGSVLSSAVTPVSIFTQGWFGSSTGPSFGQDFPLASTLWTNLGAWS